MIEIDRRDFNKLNQLDRIEYRQRFNLIKDFFKRNVNGPTNILLILMISLNFYLADMPFIGSFVARVGLVYALFYMGLDLIKMFKEKGEIKRLNKEYFKITKKKNGYKTIPKKK